MRCGALIQFLCRRLGRTSLLWSVEEHPRKGHLAKQICSALFLLVVEQTVPKYFLGIFAPPSFGDKVSSVLHRRNVQNVSASDNRLDNLQQPSSQICLLLFFVLANKYKKLFSSKCALKIQQKVQLSCSALTSINLSPDKLQSQLPAGIKLDQSVAGEKKEVPARVRVQFQWKQELVGWLVNDRGCRRQFSQFH